MTDFRYTPEGVRDIVRLTNALRDADTPGIHEALMEEASADPGKFLGGAVALLMTIREDSRDPGLVLHERADLLIGRTRLGTDGPETGRDVQP